MSRDWSPCHQIRLGLCWSVCPLLDHNPSRQIAPTPVSRAPAASLFYSLVLGRVGCDRATFRCGVHLGSRDTSKPAYRIAGYGPGEKNGQNIHPIDSLKDIDQHEQDGYEAADNWQDADFASFSSHRSPLRRHLRPLGLRPQHRTPLGPVAAEAAEGNSRSKRARNTCRRSSSNRRALSHKGTLVRRRCLIKQTGA